MREPVYLDYNATTPVASEVAETVMRCLSEVFGNPSSSHGSGERAAAIVAESRVAVAWLLGTRAEEVIFTGCATKSGGNVTVNTSKTPATAIGLDFTFLGVGQN